MPYSFRSLPFLLSLSLLLLIFYKTSASPHCIPSERDLLLQFKSSINLTIPYYNFYDLSYEDNPLHSWGGPKSNFNCCAWHGISCHRLSGNVISLRLPGFSSERKDNVQPSEVLKPLCRLRMLTSLDLSSNFQLNGISVPEEVSSLSHLLYLDISYVNILGHLPPQLAHISSLKVLKVGNGKAGRGHVVWVAGFPNALTPALLSKLKGLQELSLSYVNLNGSGWGKAMCSLHNVKRLNLAASTIEWPFARCLQNWTLLTHLALDGAQVSDFSSLKALTNLTNLQYLSVDDVNATRGTPSSLLNALPNLTRLKFLSLNALDFHGSSFFSTLDNLTHLEYLSAGGCQINESIPSDFHASHPFLSHLGLSENNSITKSLPPFAL